MPAVEQCPFRDRVKFDDAGCESATCGLLVQLIGCRAEWPAVRVPRPACDACCREIPPALDRLNPVVASFLIGAAQAIQGAGGIDGCDRERAGEIAEWAESFVELHIPGGHSRTRVTRSFSDCCYLGSIVGHRCLPSSGGSVHQAVYRCHHPGHSLTTEAECHACRDWSTADDSPPVELRSLLPRPPSWRGTDNVRWAIGVTTAPRREPTLEFCLDSLARAGFPDPMLFVDGQTRAPDRYAELEVTLRTPAVGGWPNYYLSALQLIETHPDADAVMVVQDDALFHDRTNLYDYVNTILWPENPSGIVSLYCSAAYTRDDPGWYEADQRWEWGALAFVFPMPLARKFVHDADVVGHRWTDRGLRFIDDVIGKWAERNGVPIWYPSPSLVQHCGDTSTMWPGVPAAGFRRADSFAGDAFGPTSESC